MMLNINSVSSPGFCSVLFYPSSQVHEKVRGGGGLHGLGWCHCCTRSNTTRAGEHGCNRYPDACGMRCCWPTVTTRAECTCVTHAFMQHQHNLYPSCNFEIDLCTMHSSTTMDSLEACRSQSAGSVSWSIRVDLVWTMR